MANERLIEKFMRELMREFILLCHGTDFEKLTLLKIGDTVERLYEKYGSVDAVPVWIPVTERLPDKEFWEHQARYEDEDLEVLVMIKGAKLPTMLYYNDEGEFYAYDMTDGGQTFYLVTHWMSLPEPPEED